MSDKSRTMPPSVALERPALFPKRTFQMPPPLVILLIVVVGFLVLTPLFLMILNSFQTARPGQPSSGGIDGWIKLSPTPGIVKAMTNTVTLALTRQAIALLIGAFFAWLIARTDIPDEGHCWSFFSGCPSFCRRCRRPWVGSFARSEIWVY